MNIDVSKWLIPGSIIITSFFLGFIFQKTLLKKMQNVASKRNWRLSQILFESLNNVPILWFGLLGIYGASMLVPLPIKFLKLLQQTLLIGTVFSITWFLANFAASYVSLYSSKSEFRKTLGILPSTSILNNLTKAIILGIGLLIIANSLGISITPIITALGVGGLAVSLALQDTLSNLFAGLHIILSHQLRPGDYIELNGQEGYITDINWRNTTIKELSNNCIVIPNAKLSSAVVKNYYLPETEMAVLVEVSVDYDNDLSKVEKITSEVGKEIMQKIEGGIPRFDTFIRYHTFEAYIGFTVILRAKQFTDQFLVKHEFIKKLHERYRDEEISIYLPTRSLQFKEPIKYEVSKNNTN